MKNFKREKQTERRKLKNLSDFRCRRLAWHLLGGGETSPSGIVNSRRGDCIVAVNIYSPPHYRKNKNTHAIRGGLGAVAAAVGPNEIIFFLSIL